MQQYLFEISRRIGRRCSLTVLHPDGNPSLFSEEPFQLVTFGQNRTGRFPVDGNSRPSLGAAVLTSWRIARALATLPPPCYRCRTCTSPAAATCGNGQRTLPRPGARQTTLKRRSCVGMPPSSIGFWRARNHWWTNSHANAQRLQKLGLPFPEVLPPGTDPDRFTPPSSPPSGPPILLTVARLVSRKGIDTVLRALPPLLDRAPRLQYWIVGNGPARALRLRNWRRN